ncbi:MAG TPA: YdcH family protein [Vicinamibacterales bacterium]|nr:YdcH family protein [Vicinamibacterales bacterium]
MTDSEDARLRQLSADHHSLDDRLKRLATKAHLSDDEQLEEVRLKKEKLRLKDQMESLRRQLSDSSPDALPA